MKRTIFNKLLAWKGENDRKPLILKGLRQTGKTFILKEFGKSAFKRYHYLNFQSEKSFHPIFDGDLNPVGIVKRIEFALGTNIDIESDLLIFDEVQDCSRALTSLKYFNESMPKLAVCCAGSLLGVVHPAESFPVGKVNFLHLYPMSFEEFLYEADSKAWQALNEIVFPGPVETIIHERLMERLREYYVVGGMPEVVNTFLKEGQGSLSSFDSVRRRQLELMDAFKGDFAKYAENVRANEIVALFESLPSRLARENRIFKPSDVRPGARFSRLAGAVDWLCGAGLVHRVYVTNSAELPFSAFTQLNKFKLYLADVGLLGCLAGLSPGAILSNADPFATFKGAYCENYVAQEFVAAMDGPQYGWASGNQAEIEFLREIEGAVIPVEVKAGHSGKLKSLNVFSERYHPPYRIRISARDLEINNSAALHSYPLYLASRIQSKK
jgi:uncharacterized protein